MTRHRFAVIVAVSSALAIGACAASTDERAIDPAAAKYASTAPEPRNATSRPLTPKAVKIGYKVKSKECFGSAGCNWSIALKPTVAKGFLTPESPSYEVSYRIDGGTGGPVEGTLLTSGTKFEDQLFDTILQTPSRGTKIKIVVTQVEEV